ncbi:MAG: DinB family protein [Anaerolinea sp.]|nr:DinB family protein [Anaerolinea sp.]
MDLAAVITRMRAQAEAIRQLVKGISPDQARWKPSPESWSILEVINHLCDEERDDFRTRLKHVLEHTEGLPPGIDPVGWVTERHYNERDLAASVVDFLRERAASLDWLETLTDADWDTAITMPWGSLRAGDLLHGWVAHDLLHVRQLTELLYAYQQQSAQPYSLRYGGEW